MAHYHTINYTNTNANTNYKYEIFREDVIDRFICIVKMINDNNIPTQINYNNLLENIIADFKLNKILIIINLLAHDKFIKENFELYNISMTYCNEIINNELIKNIIPFDKHKTKEKID
jgi:hypothetical protein